VDCQQYVHFCQEQQIGLAPALILIHSFRFYPTLRIFPTRKGRGPRSYVMYNGPAFGGAIIAQLTSHLNVKARLSSSRVINKVNQLSPDDYDREVRHAATMPWLVSFGAPWCQPCQNFQPYFTLFAARMKKTRKIRVC
jgi:thiol:disulfide interchange protein